MKNLEKVFSEVVQLAQLQAVSQQQLNAAIAQLANQMVVQPSLPTTQPAYVPASIVPDIPIPKQPKKVVTSQFPARIMAIKPCSTCSYAITCPQNGKRNILPECGAEVAGIKEAALFTGEIVVEMNLDKMGYPVYRDGVMIGVVPRITDTKKVIHELEEQYMGKSVRVRTYVDTKKMVDRTNVYTNCFFEILGEIDSKPTKQTPPPAEPAYELPEPIEPSTLQLGEIELPY